MSSTTSSTDKTTIEPQTGDIMFGKFVIPAASVFYRSDTSLSYAFVNLRPIVPGHVLVIPQQPVATLAEMSHDAHVDLWTSVRTVQSILRTRHQATAFNVAVQDGRAAGQSVPHVHVHVLPRGVTGGDDDDREDDDEIHADLEAWAPRSELRVPTQDLQVPDDSDRKDRTTGEMADEAAEYRRVLQEMTS